MVASCAAVNCTNHRTANVSRSFFTFPKDTEQNKKWVAAMKRDKWTPSKHALLCSDHFTIDNFWFNNERRTLKPNSIPTIFNFPTHLMKKPSTRPAPKKRKLQSDDAMHSVNSAGAGCDPKLMPSCEETQSSAVHMEHSYSFPSPRKVMKMYIQKKQQCMQLQRKLKTAKQKVKRKQKANADLKVVLSGLKRRLCETGSLITENCFTGVLKDLLLNHANGFKKNEYPDSVKTFALTLNFYSAKAYSYLRKFVKLPHPRTIRQWAVAVDGRPGFTEESFHKIASEVKKAKDAAKDNKQPEVPILGCLMMDEIAIKKQIDYDGQHIIGHCDLGNGPLDSEDTPVAREALVFMVTAINQSWKIPVGYCLINGLSSDTRVNLITQYLRKLHETGIRIVAVTCDGTSSNKSMYESLGVNLNGANNQSWFLHPSNREQKVYCLLDAAHMLKLCRNLIGEKKLLIDGTVATTYNNKIDWKYFQDLEKLQSKEGLHAGNKLRKRHVEWQQQKMKVALAAQTLSNSVGNAMEFCRDMGLQEFQSCESTVRFVKTVDVIFDLLNSCHPYGVGTKHPITKKNQALVLKRVEDGVHYLRSLKLSDGTPVWESNRKTPVFGLVLDLLSIKGLAEEYVWCEQPVLNFFLTRRLSQDHLELFFATIRNRGGNSNNPTALQFRSAYRKCLLARIDPSALGNCQSSETSSMLQLHNVVLKPPKPEQMLNTNCDLPANPTFSSLSLFCENVVEYIAGNVVRACSKKITCEDCLQVLLGNKTAKKGLIKSKDCKNGLINPPKDVVRLCASAETVFRSKSFLNNNGKGNLMLKLVCQTMFILPRGLFSSSAHLFSATDIDEEPHYSVLVKMLLKQYFTIRLHYECRQTSEALRGVQVRQKLTKLILFKGQ